MLVKRRPLTAVPIVDGTAIPPVQSGARALDEAIAFIDHGLEGLAHRQIVTANEVSDLLLDLRIILLVAEFEQVDPGASSIN